MNSDDNRRAAELLKDLIVDRKRSSWPKVFGAIAALALAAGAAYWYHLPLNQRPALNELGTKLSSFVHSFVNAPVLGSSSAPGSPTPQKHAAPPPASDTGLLSN